MVTTDLVTEVASDPAAGVVYAIAAGGGGRSKLLVVDGRTRAVVSTIPLDFDAGLVDVNEATGDVCHRRRRRRRWVDYRPDTGLFKLEFDRSSSAVSPQGDDQARTPSQLRIRAPDGAACPSNGVGGAT